MHVDCILLPVFRFELFHDVNPSAKLGLKAGFFLLISTHVQTKGKNRATKTYCAFTKEHLGIVQAEPSLP